MSKIKKINITDISEIDWSGYLIKKQKANHAKKQNRGSQFWDSRAPSFAGHAVKTGYPEMFLKILKPGKSWSVLDMGCGGGTIAIPLSAKVKEITAVDFSGKMIEILTEKTSELGINNIKTIRASWEDDWAKAGIGEYDVAIASRSLALDDIKAGIIKLDNAARKRVCISTVVGDGPHDRKIYEAAGREYYPSPDYIYIYNLLFQMGIRANIQLTNERTVKVFKSYEDAFDSHKWMFQNMTTAEEKRLNKFLQDHLVEYKGAWALDYNRLYQWAVIWWDKDI